MEYSRTNIFIDDKYDFSMPSLYSELDVLAGSFHQNNDNPDRKEFHYFLGDSSVVVLEYKKKANIKVIALNDVSLSNTKSKIEKILEDTRPKQVI